MRQRLEDDRRIQPPQARAAQLGIDDDGGEAQRRGVAHRVDRKDLRLVPLGRVRGELGRREAVAASSIARWSSVRAKSITSLRLQMKVEELAQGGNLCQSGASRMRPAPRRC